MSSTNTLNEIVRTLADAALSGDLRKLELQLLTTIRKLKGSDPELAKDLGQILASHTSGGSLRRADSHVMPAPADPDGGMSLLRFNDVNTASEPVFSEFILSQVNRLVAERKDIKSLYKAGLTPPKSLLLIGPPGTGKTMLAKWLACRTGLTFATLDLATTISSFLGKTGYNLRRILDWGRTNPCLMLLDEFDAIAKRRDDQTEVGELKRIVNVLLKELEEWPHHSLLVAATNHPELLDPAIRRRFDWIIELPLPEAKERTCIMQNALTRYGKEIDPSFLSLLVDCLSGINCSDLESFIAASVRCHLIEKASITEALLSTMAERFSSSIGHKEIQMMKDAGGRQRTVRELATMLGRSPSTVQYHLKKGKSHGRKSKKAHPL